MRLAGALLVMVVFTIAVFTVSKAMRPQEQPDRESNQKDPGRFPGGRVSGPGSANRQELAVPQESAPGYEPVPVELNRSPEVRDGFRGDVHPLLHGGTRLEVKAEWTPISKGRDGLHKYLDKRLYSWFTDLRPARPRQIYTDRDFSAFLPQIVGEVGQLWELDAAKVLEILKQFHPHPSLHLVAAGRRAGPDGAFAILRAISPSYLDIWFRIHAEFYLTPQERRPNPNAWYTPAYFIGRVLVNKQTGTVEYFDLHLPAEKALNVHLTIEGSDYGLTTQPHEIVRVERMELSGGDGQLADTIPWINALSVAEAHDRLAKVFYKFLDINWVPFDQVLAQARRGDRPIFAIVSWGSTEDQSC